MSTVRRSSNWNDTGFTIMPNAMLRNPDLSARAKGIAGYIASHSSTFIVTREQIVKDMREGRDAVQAALNELKAAGYLRVERDRDSAGRLGASAYVLEREPILPGGDDDGDPAPRDDDRPDSPDDGFPGDRSDLPTGKPADWKTGGRFSSPPIEEQGSLREPVEDQDNPSSSAIADATTDPPTPAPKAKRDLNAGRDDVERVCQHLADRIEANGSKRPTITKAWRDAARLLMDRDGRDEAAVMRCINWCQEDDFWRGVVLCMPTLRKQYDRLRLAAQRAQQPRTSGVRRSSADETILYLQSLKSTNKQGAIPATQSMFQIGSEALA